MDRASVQMTLPSMELLLGMPAMQQRAWLWKYLQAIETWALEEGLVIADEHVEFAFAIALALPLNIGVCAAANKLDELLEHGLVVKRVIPHKAASVQEISERDSNKSHAGALPSNI